MTIESLSSASSSKIEAFLSYAHEPDKFLNLSEPLHRDLVGMIKLRSNRDVEIFRDKIDLRWGDRWKATIDNGLSNSSVLFVIATTHYLDSDNCRDEFMDFLNAAKASGLAGARRLILPIVPIAAPTVFTEESDDEVASEIAAIQYELIEDAVIAGEGSPEWKRALIRLADRFIEVVTAAEAEAAAGAVAAAKEEEKQAKSVTAAPGKGVAVASGNQSSPDEVVTDDRGFFDALGDIESDFEDLTELTDTMSGLMGTVVKPMQGLDLSKASSARELNAKLARLAKAMTADSAAMGETGRAVRDKANSVDVSIRHLVRMAKSTDGASLSEGVRQLLENANKSLAQTGDVVGQMEGLLTSMAPAEAASTLMRNALKPMRSGIVAFNDGVRVIQKWGPELMD